MEKKATILLVEDNHMDVELTLNAFKTFRFGNTIQIAWDGQEALDYIFGREGFGDREKYPMPDLILLDLKLPGIDGFEVLRQIKKADRIKRIPVIILTSSREEGDRALGYDCGANSYLVKPISFDGFMKVVEQVSDYWLYLNVEPPI